MVEPIHRSWFFGYTHFILIDPTFLVVFRSPPLLLLKSAFSTESPDVKDALFQRPSSFFCHHQLIHWFIMLFCSLLDRCCCYYARNTDASQYLYYCTSTMDTCNGPVGRARELENKHNNKATCCVQHKKKATKSTTVLQLYNCTAQHTLVYHPHTLPCYSMNDIVSFLSRREVIATVVVPPVAYWYWNPLVESLDNSVPMAVLIVVCAWVGIATDLNKHMTGQPEAAHHHHHDW